MHHRPDVDPAVDLAQQNVCRESAALVATDFAKQERACIIIDRRKMPGIGLQMDRSHHAADSAAWLILCQLFAEALICAARICPRA